MKIYSSALVIALLLVAAAPAAGKDGVGANGVRGSVTIRGSFSTGGQTLTGWRVLALATSGRSYAMSIRGRRFSIKVPKALLDGMSLQLVDATGAYGGPVLLRRTGNIGATRLSAKATTRLGSIALKQGYGVLLVPLPARAVDSKGSARVRLRNGAPLGAGRLGLIRAKASPKAKRGTRQSGGTSVSIGGSCTPTAIETLPGGDCDGDGIPNVFDVDDNGNLSLDAVDAASVATSARINLTFGSTTDYAHQVNAYAGTTTRSDINAWLGATGDGKGMSMGFYLLERFIDPNARSPFQDVWLTCTAAQPWCASGTATAYIGGMSNTPPLLPGLASGDQAAWFGYTGSTCAEDGTNPCTPVADGQPNSLTGLDRGGDDPNKVDRVWSGSVLPRSADTLGEVLPKDVLTLSAREADGTVYSQPTAISPYFVTSPGLEGYTTGGVATTVLYPVSPTAPGTSFGNAIGVGADGRLTLRMWRPQRLALPGEVGSDFYDVAGLNWGVVMGSYYSSSGAYTQLDNKTFAKGAVCTPTDVHGATSLGAAATGKQQLVDLSTVDFQTDVAMKNDPSAYIEFTIDVPACLASSGAPADAAGTRIDVRASGATYEGGQVVMTGFMIEVRLPL